MKRTIVAKFTHEGREYVGKRTVTMYDGDGQEVVDANVGLTLREQASIRTALKARYGLAKITTGGVAVDLSEVDEV